MPNPDTLKLPEVVPTLTKLKEAIESKDDAAAWKEVHERASIRPTGAPKFV